MRRHREPQTCTFGEVIVVYALMRHCGVHVTLFLLPHSSSCTASSCATLPLGGLWAFTDVNDDLKRSRALGSQLVRYLHHLAHICHALFDRSHYRHASLPKATRHPARNMRRDVRPPRLPAPWHSPIARPSMQGSSASCTRMSVG